jgi:subtilisin family serine protease
VAQELGKDGAGVIVAVIDTGVDSTHQDLRGATVPGRNVARGEPADDIDTGPHGTGIASLIAGRGHGSGDGILGVAPRSEVMSISPAIDRVGVAEGIHWAVDHGAKVINMSFALDAGDTVRRAIDDAAAADVVVVGAVGNEHGPVDEPAVFPGVLGVGTVERNNKVASFSNHGAGVDLVAYGAHVPVALPHDRYELNTGTSNSSALVAGAAALIRARYPDMSAAEVVDRLTRTAIDRGPHGRDDYYGYGQLDVIAALTAPRIKPTATAAPATASGGPAGAPVATAPVADQQGLPGWLFLVVVGLLVLVVALAAVMIVRARRNP